MTRFALLRALEKVGIRHAFLEDCPCGGCEDFFGFGRGPGASLWIAFSTDGAEPPLRLWSEGEPPLPLAHVSRELRQVLRRVRNVLDVSDPAPGPSPLTHFPEPALDEPSPGYAARVLARISAAKRKPRPTAKRLTFHGETLTIREWSERTGVDRTSIDWRLSSGWTVKDALTTPVKKRRTA